VIAYINKQISSVMQKSKVFNDGQKYTPKNAGRNNKEIKAIDLLIEQLQAIGNEEGLVQAQAARDAKMAEITAKKTAAKVLKVDDLPAELQGLAM